MNQKLKILLHSLNKKTSLTLQERKDLETLFINIKEFWISKSYVKLRKDELDELDNFIQLLKENSSSETDKTIILSLKKFYSHRPLFLDGVPNSQIDND